VSVRTTTGALVLALIVGCSGSPEPTQTPEDGGPEPTTQAPAATPPQAARARLPVPPPQAASDPAAVEERRREIEMIPFEEPDSKVALEKLSRQLSDPELDVREAVVMALAELEGPDATQALAEHARVERDGMLKIDIVDELIDRQAPQTLDTLLFLLGDTDPDVREASADGLDELGDQRAIPALHDALRAEADEFVRDAILFALTSLDFSL
jgi:HEAT repeat protein